MKPSIGLVHPKIRPFPTWLISSTEHFHLFTEPYSIMRNTLTCLNCVLIFGHFVVSQDLPLTGIDDSDLVFPDISETNNIFTSVNGQLADDSLLAPSFEMTSNDDATQDTNLFLANEKSDFCTSSSSLSVIDAKAGSESGLAARGASCVNPDTPDAGARLGAGIANLDSIYTPDDERERSIREVREYWCGDNEDFFKGFLPVCSTKPDTGSFEIYLESTLSKLLFFIIHCLFRH